MIALSKVAKYSDRTEPDSGHYDLGIFRSAEKEIPGDGEHAEPAGPDLGEVQSACTGRFGRIVGVVSEQALVFHQQPHRETEPEDQKQDEGDFDEDNHTEREVSVTASERRGKRNLPHRDKRMRCSYIRPSMQRMVDIFTP